MLVTPFSITILLTNSLGQGPPKMDLKLSIIPCPLMVSKPSSVKV